jgi:hypothetical protein
MRVSSIILAAVGLAGAMAIRSDDHSVLLELSADKQQMELDLAVNEDIRNAQQSVVDQVASGNVVTDSQIDAAVKTAFEPIFSKCESIVDPKHQRRCLLNVAAGKKITRKGSRSARLRKMRQLKKEAKEAKKEATKNATKAAKNATKTVKKDKLASHADKIKKHIAAAKKHEAAMKKEQSTVKTLEAKVKADLAKQSAEAKEVIAAIKKTCNATTKATKANATAVAVPKAKTNATKVEKVEKKVEKKEEKATSFLEFESEMDHADFAIEAAQDAARENIFAFLEVSEEVEPHQSAEEHLDSIDVSLLDMESLDIPHVDANEVDSVLSRAEALTSDDVASFLEGEEEVVDQEQQEAEAEAEHEQDAEVEHEAEHEEEAEPSFIDQSDEARAHESEASLIAAAEAEMNRDLAARDEVAKKDVIDLSDLESIDNLDL